MSELPKESSVAGVKAVLTEALAAHQWRGNTLGCGCGWNWPEELTYFCGEEERIAKAHAGHVADVLLALSGVAVIQLPEPATLTPAYEDDVTHAWEWDADSFLALGGDGIAGGTHLLDSRHVEDLLPLAAAILAAARVYELRFCPGRLQVNNPTPRPSLSDHTQEALKVAENHAQTAGTAGVEHVRVYKIRPKDVLCDVYGNAIGVVTVTAHPSPVDYEKTSEFTVELPGGDRQDFELPAGVRVWRKFQR